MSTQWNEERFVNPLPEKPGNFWELLRWMYEEPLALFRMKAPVSKKERILFLLKNIIPSICVATFVSIFIWALLWGLIIALQLPQTFPKSFSEPIQGIVGIDTSHFDIWGKSLIQTFNNGLLIGFTYGLLTGLISGLSVGLSTGSVGGLSVGLSIGSVGGLSVGLTEGSTIGFQESFELYFQINSLEALEFPLPFDIVVFSLAMTVTGALVFGVVFGAILDLREVVKGGLAYCLISSLFGGLGYGLAHGFDQDLEQGLAFGMTQGLAGSLAGGLATISPIYHLILFLRNRQQNPEALIAERGRYWLLTPMQENALLEKAKQSLTWTFDFTFFISENRRPLWTLAARLLHQAVSSSWKKDVLAAEVLEFPPIQPKTQKFYTVGKKSLSSLEKIKKVLIEVGQEENHIRRSMGYQEVYISLNYLRLDLVGQIPGRFFWQRRKTWIQDYVDALDLWIKETEGRIQNLEQEARNRLPFGENPYVPGKALTPKNGEDVFRGRKAVSDQLARRITGSRELPMVLVQGQRRVGKTSLINFLETLLDRRFLVIKQDLQQGGCDTIGGWLQDLRQKVNTAFDHKEETEWIPGGNWANDWETLGNHIIKLAEAHEMRIILALDEYERLHFLLQQLPLTDAKHLLEAMRSFSQHQNRVVLLFAGLLDLVDLTEPDWSGIFVQRELIRVDYLTETDTKDLLQAPILNYPIQYDPGLIDHIWELTQGQPTLVQEIGSCLFDQASSRRDPNVTHFMLEECLDSTILTRGNQVMRVFWTEFCKAERYKKAVVSIIETGSSPDKPVVLRLKDYGFIVEVAENQYKMRTPLFEEWVKRNKDYFE